LILVLLIGNAAEHATAVVIASRNNMDFSMFISIGSSLQVALLVAPILVFLGPLLGHPLQLTFTVLELASLAGAVAVATIIALDGESNWMEGVMLCGVYLVAGFTFFFL
jgi:Ca2+:H+ antiporter